eukprot:1968360-Pleurochrysis_carterae.AAC.1
MTFCHVPFIRERQAPWVAAVCKVELCAAANPDEPHLLGRAAVVVEHDVDDALEAAELGRREAKREQGDAAL